MEEEHKKYVTNTDHYFGIKYGEYAHLTLDEVVEDIIKEQKALKTPLYIDYNGVAITANAGESKFEIKEKYYHELAKQREHDRENLPAQEYLKRYTTFKSMEEAVKNLETIPKNCEKTEVSFMRQYADIIMSLRRLGNYLEENDNVDVSKYVEILKKTVGINILKSKLKRKEITIKSIEDGSVDVAKEIINNVVSTKSTGELQTYLSSLKDQNILDGWLKANLTEIANITGKNIPLPKPKTK